MNAAVPGPPTSDRFGLVLRFAFYVFVAIAGLPVFGFVLGTAGYLIASAGSVFAAALTANALSLRVFERVHLAAAGLGWHAGSGRNLAMGIASGVLAAAAVTVLPMLAGMAEIVPDPDRPASAAAAIFVTLVLFFGAVGEELLFRGYGFQILVAMLNPVAALAATAILFGAVHMQNLHATPLGIVNTAGFGVVLGYAFLRAGELWLPIGIHFGWNWMLSVAGVSVSGFKIGISGYALRWNVSEYWSGGAYGPEASVLTCVMVIALLIFLRRERVYSSVPVLVAMHRQEK